MEKTITINDNDYSFELINQTDDKIVFEYEGKEYQYWIGHKERNVTLVSRTEADVLGHAFNLDASENKQVIVNDKEVIAKLKGKVEGKANTVQLTEGSLQSPMPGKIFKILKEVGSTVNAGEPVLIMEAMKMEHTICATKEGIVKEIFYSEGEQVQGGVLLCEIE